MAPANQLGEWLYLTWGQLHQRHLYPAKPGLRSYPTASLDLALETVSRYQTEPIRLWCLEFVHDLWLA